MANVVLSSRHWWKRDWLLRASTEVEHNWGARGPWSRCLGLVCQNGELFSSCRREHNSGRRPQHVETRVFSRTNIVYCDSVASILEKVAFPALMQSCPGFQPCSSSWLHPGPARLCSRLPFLLLLSVSCLTDQHILLSWTVSVILLFLQPSYHQLPITLAPRAAAHFSVQWVLAKSAEMKRSSATPAPSPADLMLHVGVLLALLPCP